MRADGRQGDSSPSTDWRNDTPQEIRTFSQDFPYTTISTEAQFKATVQWLRLKNNSGQNTCALNFIVLFLLCVHLLPVSSLALLCSSVLFCVCSLPLPPFLFLSLDISFKRTCSRAICCIELTPQSDWRGGLRPALPVTTRGLFSAGYHAVHPTIEVQDAQLVSARLRRLGHPWRPNAAPSPVIEHSAPNTSFDITAPAPVFEHEAATNAALAPMTEHDPCSASSRERERGTRTWCHPHSTSSSNRVLGTRTWCRQQNTSAAVFSNIVSSSAFALVRHWWPPHQHSAMVNVCATTAVPLVRSVFEAYLLIITFLSV